MFKIIPTSRTHPFASCHDIQKDGETVGTLSKVHADGATRYAAIVDLPPQPGQASDEKAMFIVYNDVILEDCIAALISFFVDPVGTVAAAEAEQDEADAQA